MKRIGPRMAEASAIVRRCPGTAILPVARKIGPNGSVAFGYRAVHRAIKAGLIVATFAHGRYVLTPPPREGSP